MSILNYIEYLMINLVPPEVNILKCYFYKFSYLHHYLAILNNTHMNTSWVSYHLYIVKDCLLGLTFLLIIKCINMVLAVIESFRLSITGDYD
ncbi:hypothetical protein BCR32DRAFT_281595 [Anaeromyces robustus]|uniref:Uncharacterized protein n=1 Tax=Anaeromyces robustus TaxID=1754192 RepID=A0A1Y1X0A3_9FUNG|nr:hypothetical protein BCR32DRAFT_281595 [Anaeromyces robustus]|eukprot:ORX79220.1 hypothetical protein BCR32DRAFT_281595 [Anaeromyces robustus]